LVKLLKIFQLFNAEKHLSASISHVANFKGKIYCIACIINSPKINCAVEEFTSNAA